MLERYSVAGYRSFYEVARVNVRPLTLIYGRNASGKSALLRAVALLHASLITRDPQPLDLSAPMVRGMAYADVASSEGDRLMRWSVASGDVELTVEVRDLSPSGAPVVETLRLARGGCPVVEAKWKLGSAPAYDVVDASGRREATLAFQGLLPKDEALGDLRRILSPILDVTVEWLSAKREAPRDHTESCALTPDEHAGRSERVRLAVDRRRGGQLLHWVDERLRRVVGHRVVITEAGPAVEAFVLRTGRGERGPLVRLANTGEGVAHVLPVLIALGRASVEPGERIHLIEQPELHLHPAAEAELGGVLAEAAQRTRGARFVVETHSDNLLLGVQLAIATGRLDKERVGLCLVEQDASGRSTVAQSDFSDVGGVDLGSRRSFEEGTNLARELLRTRLELSRRDHRAGAT